jgi:hypothetical protein
MAKATCVAPFPSSALTQPDCWSYPGKRSGILAGVLLLIGQHFH